MSSERLAAIDRVVRRGVSAGGFPGAAVVVGRRGYAVWQRGYGWQDWGASSRAVDPASTMYDLASITKVVATTTAIMLLYDQKKIHLDDPVSKYLPGFRGGGRDRVTIRHLLTHRSGLPAGRDLWDLADSPSEARRVVIATRLEYEPGDYTVYSDLGPDLLGFIVEKVTHERLDRFLARRVFGPLGMSHTAFRPSLAVRSRVAPTGPNIPRGTVHDRNARALGGIAGHAGLFSTAADLAVFAQMMLNGGTYNGVRLIRDSTVALFTRRSGGGRRALGWDTCGGGGSCGHYLSERAYGHTGFTGTSLWIDPERGTFVILLTNEVNAPHAYDPIAVLSDVRADLADIAALAVTDGAVEVPSMPDRLRADRAIGWYGDGNGAR